MYRKYFCARSSAEKRMKVRIDSVVRIGEEVLVMLSTDFGKASAVWCGAPPTIGASHDVELEIEQSVVWGMSARPASNDGFSIDIVDGFIKLTGNIVSVDTEGMMVFDVGGSVFFVEIIGFAGAIPMVVDLYVEKLVLFPTGV
ncbi:hypothetical protein D3C72_1406250 [compost metagenome]